MITVLTFAEGVRMVDGIVLEWLCFCGNDNSAYFAVGGKMIDGIVLAW